MRHLLWTILVAGVIILPGCSKKNFLDAKPNTNLFIPSTLDDFQELLDKDAVINETPELGELCSDNYYLTSTLWAGIPTKEHNAYIWAPDVYQGQGNVGDWNTPYMAVFYANVVLDGIDTVAVTSDNRQRWSAIKGTAYFTRAYAFYNIAQVFAPVFDSATAGSDMGIPLRLTSGVDEVSTRASVKSTYEQIISDLTKAVGLLPDTIAYSNRNRPSRPAAMAMLARTYLSMRAYDKAGAWADSCLGLYNTLLDYNAYVSGGSVPFSRSNNETMYQSRILSATYVLKGVVVSGCVVDSNLYSSYVPNDLRRTIFYTYNPPALPNIKGSYTGSIFAFSGLATDEVYLIRAECYARAGNTTAAMNDLNTLLQTRWASTSPYVPFTAATSKDALAVILTERRKELAFRGLRWTDIRRLNKEGYNITLTRFIGGVQYQLPPGRSALYLIDPSRCNQPERDAAKSTLRQGINKKIPSCDGMH